MKKNNGRLFLLLVVLFGVMVFPGTDPGMEQDKKQSPHQVPQVTARIKVDGILDEKIWQEALALTLDYEVAPGENIEPPVKTEVLLLYGTKHLYVGIRAYDPHPADIRARVTHRDNITDDDYVGVVLDTFNDSRRAYAFYSSPYGIQADHIVDMMFRQHEWDAVWNSAGKITPWGYAVEMAIPFTSLHFQQGKDGQVWGIDAVRSRPRKYRHLMGLFPRDRNNNCYMCQAGKITGLKGVRPGINLELEPMVTALQTQERESFPQGKFIKKTDKIDPSLDMRWSFTPNLTLEAALNPDFSQVEADDPQLEINTQFPLYYPEKRPFFLEGANIYETRFFAVDTRSVINPDWGIKFAGKGGKHALGFFSTRDSLTRLWFADSERTQTTSVDMHNIGTVLRYRLDAGRASNLGFLITDREGKDYFNRVAGIDGDLRITLKDGIVFQYLASQTRYPRQVAGEYQQPTGKFNGGAFEFLYYHHDQHVIAFAHYQDVTPFFRADLGFVDQTGTKTYEGGGEYTWYGNPGHWYTALNIGARYFHMIARDNHPLQKTFHFTLDYNGPLYSRVRLNGTVGKRTYQGKEFDNNTLDFAIRVRPSGSLFLGVTGTIGDQVDFTGIRAGKRLRLEPGIRCNIGRHLYLGLFHVYERLKIESRELYTANLSNIRMEYHITPRAFLRAILQYADNRYNTSLYSHPLDPGFKHLFTQVLFSYKINPRTVLYLGYTDDGYGSDIIPLTRNNLTFYLKIGYTLAL